MTQEKDISSEFVRTLETHETAVKRAIESLGAVQAELADVAKEGDDAIDGELATLGRRLETHERHLEAVVSTLDEHKSVARSGEPVGARALEEAKAKARYRARTESSHPSSDPSSGANADR